MTRDEILQKSRNENCSKDVYDLDVQKKAAFVSIYVALGLCILISLLKGIISHTVCYEVWLIFFGIEATLFGVKFGKMKKRHELFVCIGYVILFACCCVAWIFQLIK